jgi:hypothetical protein
VPLVSNAADAAQVRHSGNAEADQRALEDNDLRALLGSQSGRRFIWRLLGQVGTYRSPFSPDALVMARDAGRQAVGQWLLGECGRVDGEAMLVMSREAAALQEQREAIALATRLDELNPRREDDTDANEDV